MKRVIKNVNNVDVSSNEYSLSYVVQRVVDRLFENDVALKEFYKEIFGEFLIYEYSNEATYTYNQVVWFLNDERNESTVRLENGDWSLRLYILRCNRSVVEPGSLLQYKYPKLAKDKSNSTQLLESLGWKNLNPNIDILTQYGIEKKLNSYITRVFKSHTDNEEFHKYGKLTYGKQAGKNHIDQKVAKRNPNNLNSDRENHFFPYQTYCLKKIENDPIMNGYCRKYDNGLMEFNIVFRLGYVGYLETDNEYKISSDVFECNNLNFQNDRSMDKYFNNENDMNIFQYINTNEKNFSEIGETVQRNRNDYVNVYSATVNFTQGDSRYSFANADYMIFSGDLLSQDRDKTNGSLNHSPNSLVFCNKKKDSFTAILITYPNMMNFNKVGYNASNGGLMANSFHCHLIGKADKGFSY